MDRPILTLVFTVLVPFGAEMDRAERDLGRTEPKAWQPMVAGRRPWSDNCGLTLRRVGQYPTGSKYDEELISSQAR